MPIIEFASLELIPPYSLESVPLSKLFHRLSSRQAAYSGYPLIFFADTISPSILYTVSGWHSVEANLTWIASEENGELLRSFEPFLKVKTLVHLNMDFDDIPRGCKGMVCVKCDNFNDLREYIEVEETRGEEDGEASSEGSGPASLTLFGQDVDPLSDAVYRFTVCENIALDNSVQPHARRNGLGEVIAMRRVTVPRS
jgi:hypothetical protein